MNNKDHQFSVMSESVKEFIGDMKVGSKQAQDAERSYYSGYVDGAGMAISGIFDAARLGLSLPDLVAVTDAYGRDLELWVRGNISQPQFNASYYLSRIRRGETSHE
jgi:hypothetical protein